MPLEVRRRLEREVYPAGVEGVSARYLKLASGLTVRVVEAGSRDAFPVVLIPGWGGNAWIFHKTLLPLAAAGLRPIAVELKGHGLSDKPTAAGEYTRSAMSLHLLQVLDALSLPRAGLAGHSMGAAVAVDAAAAAPDRVSGLVLVAPVGFAGVRGMTLFRLLSPEVLVSVLPFLVTPFVVRLMLRVLYGSLKRPTERDVRELHAPAAFPEFSAALRLLLHEFDWRARYPRLDLPTMAIAGSEDVLSPPSDIRRYAERTLVVAGGGHVLFDESPEAVNRAIASFFDDVTPPYISNQNE